VAPGALPLLGHVPAFRRDRLALLASCADCPRPVVRCRLGHRVLVLKDPEDIRHVLVGNHGNYARARRLTGAPPRWSAPYNLVTAPDDENRRRRRAVQPMLRGLLDGLTERAQENTERLVDGWSEGEHVDIGKAMTALARRNIFETLFQGVDDEWLGRFATANEVRRRFIDRVYFSLLPAPEYVPSRDTIPYLRAMRRIHAAVDREIALRRDGRMRDDLLSMLVTAGASNGGQMGDAEVREDVLTLAVTGYHTVGTALALTLLALARDPEVDARVAAEVGSERGDGRSSGRAEFPYTRAVIRESLRLHPPNWVFVRIAAGADRLPSGAEIPAGSKLALCSYLVHRNPCLWPEPERFDPGRFLDGATAGRPRYAYFPFGGGPRVCIGESLALAEIATVLRTLVARFEFRVAPGHRVVLEPGITLGPRRGPTLVVTPRRPETSRG
jgi:cytochrome P450